MNYHVNRNIYIRTKMINFAIIFVDMEENFMARDYIQPGPSDTSLLYLQNEHRSEAIWNGQVIMIICLGIFIMNIFYI